MIPQLSQNCVKLDSAAVSIFVVILVELKNTVFVNSTNITTNIEREGSVVYVKLVPKLCQS